MDLNQIEQILNDHTTDGTLTLPPAALESVPIEEVFRDYLLNADLVVNQVSIVNVGNQNITVVGQGGSFPFLNSFVTAVFTVRENVAAMSIEGDGFDRQANVWTFDKAFPVLASTFYKDFQFATALLTLRSSNASAAQPPGLFFGGKQELTGGLAVLAKLLNGSTEIQVTGPITIAGDQTPDKAVPVMVLADPKPGRVFEMEFIYQLLNGSRVAVKRPPDTGASTVPLPQMQMVSRITVDTASGRKFIDIAAHFTPTFTLLTFQADMDQLLEVSQAALNSLARGANLGSVLPPQLPLVNLFTLGQWSMSVVPQVPQISSISIGAAIARPWTIIPGWFELTNLQFAFTVNYVNDKYEPNAALTANITLFKGTPAQFTFVVDAQYPSYIITGFLEEDNKIDLIALVELFISRQVAQSLPCTNLKVSVMTLVLDPRNSTFTYETVVTSDCSFDLGIATFILTEIAFNFNYVAGEATGSFATAFWLVPPQGVSSDKWLADDPPPGAVAMQVSAAYNGAEDGWSFRGGLADDGKIDLEEILTLYLPPEYQSFIPSVVINQLDIGFETGKSKSYDFSIGAEWTIAVLNTKIGALVKIKSTKVDDTRKDEGEIQGFIRFGGSDGQGGLELKITAKFDDKTKVYIFEFLGWTATLSSSATEKTLTFEAGDKSLGEMIEVLINAVLPGEDIKLAPPWSVLNSIPLGNFKFVVKFSPEDSSPQTAGLTYSPNINLGFAQINKLALDYDVKTGRVMFRILEGRFLNQTITEQDPVEWDVADPATTPEVPGKGSELFHLAFLGAGQHVAVMKDGQLEPVPASVFGAIAQLDDAFRGKNDRKLVFNEATDWLIATRFMVLQAVDLGFVFYDPELYGLTISVTGSKAKEKLKIFEGLVFEILYKKINDTIGMWQIDLTLPVYIRNLQFGAVSVTLPSMKVQIYTNGDFMVDLGFPANDDFSRSFSLQAFPFVGSGGLYFGVLSSATSDKVPKTTDGTFSPVIAFGLGLRIGLGKDLDYGVLKAGMSITIQGVLEGVFAWYNKYPTALALPPINDQQLVPANSRGLIRTQSAAATTGDNFYYMIQARVALVGKIYGSVDLGIITADLDVEIRASIRFTMEAYRAIDIFFEVSISLSLRVRINLGLFKITIRLSFSMKMSFSFQIGKTDPNPPWASSVLLRQAAYVRRLDAGDDEQCPEIPYMKWQPILNPEPVKVPLMFIPQFTAGTDGPLGAGNPRKPYVVVMTYVSSAAPKDTPEVPAAFDYIAQGALLWTLNAYLNRDKDGTTLKDILTKTVTIEDLNKIYCYLTQPNVLEPFTEVAVLDFLRNFFRFLVTIPPPVPIASQVIVEEQEVSVFPIMPLLTLSTSTGVDVDFSTQTPASDEYLAQVKAYFEQMAVRYRSASEKKNEQSLRTSPEEGEKSLASFMFLDFFAMLARATVQDAISLLQEQQAPLASDESLASFVTRRSDLAIDVESLAMANATRPLRSGLQLSVPGAVYTVKRGDTLQSIAARLDHDVLSLRAANPAMNGKLPPPSSELRLPALKFTTSSYEPESLLDISRRFGVSITELARANQHVGELFPAGEPLLAPFAQEENVEALVTTLQKKGSFNNLSGLAARVLLQGLRPPSPKDSPWAGTPTPLYTLTGQQFDGSDLVADSTITLTAQAGAGEWFKLGDDDTLTYTFTAEGAAGLQALKTAPFGPPVEFETTELLRIEPRRFTLPTAVLWQTPTIFTTANRGNTQAGETVEPNLWRFPSELMQIITGEQALQPKVGLWTQRHEGPGQTYPPQPVKNYTWSTALDIQVRQTASGDGVFLPNTYEMTGIDAGGAALLENLLIWYSKGQSPAIERIRILFPPNPAVEGQTEPPTGLRSNVDPTFFLLQNNLSTTSQPPQLSSTIAAQLSAGSPQHDPLGQTDIEFLKLLWESSIVNSGGYVLYYATETKQGLPNYLFSQNGVASLTLLVTYNITDDVLQNYLNNVVIHEAIDTDNEVLYASPVPQKVSNFRLVPGETLADVASRYRVTISRLATQNSNAPLGTGRHLRIPPVTYRVRDGESLDSIADRANVTVRALTEANPGKNLKGKSKVRFLRLPETVWRAQDGDTLAMLATRFSTSIVTLAHANKDVPNLLEGNLEFDDRLETALAMIPQGNVAFTFTRTAGGSTDAEKQLNELYNLIGYRIAPDEVFEATNSALPVSPETPEGTADWIYTSVVPVFPFVIQNPQQVGNVLPDPRQDPYNGVGDTVHVNFNWQDLFGNWIDTTAGDPTWSDKRFPIGYIDNLIALDQWPSVTSDYVIGHGGQGTPELTVTMRFNAALYLPSEGVDPDAIKDMALTDLGKFYTIYYQLTQTDVKVTVSSTMQGDLPTAEAAPSAMIEFVLDIINFLQLVVGGVVDPPAPVDRAISQPVADANESNLFALIVRLAITRNLDLVNDEFKDIPSVSSVSSRVPANAGKENPMALQADPSPPLSLQEFARELEATFPNLKVLVAAPKKDLGQVAEEIWIARFAPTATGIAFEIDGKKPSFFAVEPLAKSLLSRPEVWVYPYQSGKFIGNEIPIKTSQNSVDLDQMGRDFLTAVEQVLGPHFSSATWKLQYETATPPVKDPPDPRTTPYEAIIAAKETLAKAISDHVENVFVNEPIDGLGDARESLRQQLLVNLTAAFTVDVVMQYPVKITSSEYRPDDPFAPRLFGKPVTDNPDAPHEEEKKDAWSFSTGRFSLAKRPTGTNLTFSFETNREQQGREGKQIDDVFTIDLFHQINAIEHDIHPVPGIKGYLASSWLSFVLPDSFDSPGEKKLLVPLGEQHIPVPLRAYPTPPSLSEQTFIPLVKQFVGRGKLLADSVDPMIEARMWNYRCQYEYVGAAHDKILANIKLNVPPTSLLKAGLNDPDNPDLFESLVQFSAAYPGIARDLDQYLATGTEDQKAFSAISSFAWLAQRTAKAWQTWQIESAVGAEAAEAPEYHFVISQGAEDIGVVKALVVTVTADGVLRLPELPIVEIAGFVTKVKTQTSDSVSYYFEGEQTKLVLPYDIGRDLSSRGLVFKNFDVLKVENAWAGAAVKRNEDLLPDKQTNPDFIFQTPVVRFVNVLTPLLDPDVKIDIASYTVLQPAMLAQYLSNFFIAFFEGAQTVTNENRTIQLGASYGYGLQDSDGAADALAEVADLDVTIPILLTTPKSISIRREQLSPDSEFIKSVSSTIETWFAINRPSGMRDSGKLWFDFSVYSSLSETQLPVLRMRRLFLSTKVVVLK